MQHRIQPAHWSALALAAFAWFMFASCERIDPVNSGYELAEGEILYTCESCHTDRSTLRRMANPREAAGGGG